jgi:formyl-CoA transferase
MLLAGVALERFPTRDERYNRAEEFLAELNKWFRSKTRDEIFHEAQAWRIPMGKVAAIDEVAHCEQLTAREFFARVEHPVIGAHTLPGTPIVIDSKRPRPSRPAPTLGEHNLDVLCTELGYSSDDLRALADNGVV